MKPSKKFLRSFLFFAFSSQLLHGAADINIGAANIDITVSSPFRDATDNGGTSTVSAATLMGALTTGNVVVNTATTTNLVATPNAGRITVVDSIAWSSNNSLTLTADSNVVVSTNLQSTGGGSLFINANTGVDLNANVTVTGGASNLTINSGGAVLTGAGTNITVEGLTSISAGSNTVTLGGGASGPMNFGSLAITGGSVSITEASSTVLQSINASSLNVSSAGTITDVGNISVTGATTLSGTSITLGGAQTTTLGSVNFNTTNPSGTVSISLDGNTTITGSNSALSVTWGSSGNSTFQAGATLSAGSLSNTAGNLILSGNNLVDTMNVTNAGTLTVNGADTITTYQQNGSGILAGSAVLTATNGATLNGGTVSGSLQANAVSTGTLTVSGTLSGTTLGITGGALTLTNTGVINQTSVSISSGASLINQGTGLSLSSTITNEGTLNLAVNDTISSYVQNGSGTLTGAGTLTATSGATLNGGTISGNLSANTTSTANVSVAVGGSIGGGTLLISAGTLTLNGTSTNSTVTIASGSTLQNNNGGLGAPAIVINAGSFVNASADTVANYTQNGTGSLSGAGPLTVSNVATLNGGTVSGSLIGNTVSTGTVALSGTISGSTLDVTSGTLTLTGSANSSAIAISSGATFLNSSGGIGNTSNVTNSGTLTVSANDTIGTYTQSGGTALLNGSGTLTVTSAQLNGGTVAGSLSGNTTSGGNVTVTGTVGGGSFTVASGVLSLTGSGSVTSTPVSIQASAELINATSGLSASAQIINAGALTMNSADTVDTYVQNDNGQLRGTHALTTTGGATLNGGSVISSLIGNTTSTGSVLVSGALSGGSLSVTGGVLTLSGTASNTPVSISSGAQLVNQSAGLSSTADVTNAGILTINLAETINTYTQNGALSVLNGTHALTVLNGSTLNGGTVNTNLIGNTTVNGVVTVNSALSGGFLSVTGGVLTLNGTASNNPVSISAGAQLIDANGGLSDTADVNNAGVFTLGANETIASLINSGTLNGAFILNTTGTSTFNGGTLAAGTTLNAVGGTTLNTGSVVNGTITGGAVNTNGAVTATGALNGSSLTVQSGTLTFSGTSTSATVGISSGATLLSSGDLSNSATVTNAGTFTVNAADSIGTYIQNGSGLLNGSAILTALNGATLNGGTVAGNLRGNTTSTGTVLVSGSIGGGSLNVSGGVLTLTGTSTNTPVDIASGAQLIDSNGGLDAAAVVTNAGTLTVNANDSINTYTQNGSGLLNGSATLTALNGATLNGGTVAGSLLANTVSTGTVLISGTVGGGSFAVTSGTLTLTGTINSNPTVSAGATFQGSGLVNGNLNNQGTLAVSTMGEDLTITGTLTTSGTVRLDLLNQSTYEKLNLGSIQYGGDLVVTNVGTGLSVGQTARIIEAGSYSGIFNSLDASTFTNGVLYNTFTGTLVGLGGGEIISDGGYLNLNRNQSNIYFSLFDDSVQPGTRNVNFVTSPSGTTTVQFISGISNGDAQLVRALNDATFTDPGMNSPTLMSLPPVVWNAGPLNMNVINLLSPEAHHGMADYSEEALRSHVRNAVAAPTFSQKGKTQLFATLHSTTAGTDNDITNAGYDIDTAGITLGARHDMTRQFQAGFLLGADSGNIKGSLIDTDAQGVSVGAFGRVVVDEKSKTMITGSAAFGSYKYDATRTSYEGDVTADGIGASSIELSLGLRTVMYEKGGVTLSPNATLRYFDGSVDGFDEKGSGVNLIVDSQDSSSVILDVGIDANVTLKDNFSLIGRIGYMHEFSDSEETVGARFSATGVNAVPFSVNATGIDHQAFVIGAGLCYDFAGGSRMGISYQGEYRFDAQASQNVYFGYSLGF